MSTNHTYHPLLSMFTETVDKGSTSSMNLPLIHCSTHASCLDYGSTYLLDLMKLRHNFTALRSVAYFEDYEDI